MRKKKGIFCEKCDSRAEFYKKGKARVLVCSGSCGVLAHNPKPKSAFKAAILDPLRATGKLIEGDYIGAIKTRAGFAQETEGLPPAPNRRITQFEKALALEMAEKRGKVC